jgi:hypothetical protein
MPDQLTTLRFQIDHVVAQKHRGPTTIENLAWACADCNSYKGTDLAGIDPPTGKLERLYNPRLDQWEEHFTWKGPVLLGRTAIGRVTIAVLQINREVRVELRRELIASGLL